MPEVFSEGTFLTRQWLSKSWSLLRTILKSLIFLVGVEDRIDAEVTVSREGRISQLPLGDVRIFS